jgi:hypothetical protein
MNICSGEYDQLGCFGTSVAGKGGKFSKSLAGERTGWLPAMPSYLPSLIVNAIPAGPSRAGDVSNFDFREKLWFSQANAFLTPGFLDPFLLVFSTQASERFGS